MNTGTITNIEPGNDNDPPGIVLREDNCLKQKSWEQATGDEDSVRLLTKVFAQPDDAEAQLAVKKADEGKLTCK
ncbi:MAG: hypothetical protein EOP10_06465 [Proteobacteria bacterium]|nr:MAG: hypothetical protein EOP10_06465 [Pseudomonadota bacterium]